MVYIEQFSARIQSRVSQDFELIDDMTSTCVLKNLNTKDSLVVLPSFISLLHCMTMTMIRRVSFLLAVSALFQPREVCAFQVFPRGAGKIMRTRNENEDARKMVELQKTLGIPSGLMKVLLTNAHDAFSKRIWIIDNSGSMSMVDGHKLMTTGDCTRFEEVEETVLLHAQLSNVLSAPTEFRLLNPPDGNIPSRFQVGYDTVKNGLKQAKTVLSKTEPKGKTSLHESVNKVRKEVIEMLPQLKADGSKVAIVIVTDGCNHNLNNLGKEEAEMNQDLVEALESLQGLPVSVVVRLCTDYGPVVDFYNDLDQRLDGLDILDDYLSEAKEVYQHNPWLNYSLVLHRLREMGQYSQLFDWLDERTLTREELRDFCVLLFGKEDLPCPNTDWQGFLKEISLLQLPERMHLNPRTQEMAPWIDIEGLAMLT